MDSKEKNFHSNYLPCSQYLTTQILNKYQFVPYKKIQYFSQGAEKYRIEYHTKLAGGRKLMLPSWKFFSWILKYQQFEILKSWNLEILKTMVKTIEIIGWKELEEDPNSLNFQLIEQRWFKHSSLQIPTSWASWVSSDRVKGSFVSYFGCKTVLMGIVIKGNSIDFS